MPAAVSSMPTARSPMQAAAMGGLSADTQEFYCKTLASLNDSGVPYLVGGAYALSCYTGIERHTKDLDVFVRPEDCERIMQVLAAAGWHTELTFPHWLGKAHCGEDFIDVIFSSGNGVAVVDDQWFEYARASRVLDIAVRLCPPEEMIWSKAYIMERERFDGADIMHLLRAQGAQLDWVRLLQRFDMRWRVLLTHLTLFGFVYPGERAQVPQWVMLELIHRLQRELNAPAPDERLCQGTLLSREQYLIDIGKWGYQDARLEPLGPMAKKDIVHWTAAIDPR